MSNFSVKSFARIFSAIALCAALLCVVTACDTILDALNNDRSDEPSPNPTIEPKEIRLNSSGLTLTVGGRETLTATVLPDNAANKTVTWSSDKDYVASVDKNGVITAVSVGGPVKITATSVADNEVYATCVVNVIEIPPNPPTRIIINPPFLTLGVGDTSTLTVAVEPANADKTVNWRTSNPAVVVVDENGNITAKGKGKASVFAFSVVDPLVGGECKIEVDRLIPNTIETILGYGYDITSRYAYSPDTKAAVLDLDKLLAAQRVKKDPNLKYGEFETITGNDINEYMRNITAKISYSANAGLEKVASFSSEIGANFNKERITKGEYAFTTSTSRIVTGAYNVADKSKLDSFLTRSFTDDLETMTSDKLIGKYGTHVMLGAVLGARADYHLSVRKKEQTGTTEVGAYAKAKAEATYQGVTAGAGSSTEVDLKYKQYFYTATTETRTRVFGGKVQYGQDINNKQNYDKWIESIDDENVVWIDYYPNSLVPISDLVTDKSRSNDIANAIIKYCKGKEVIVEPFCGIGPTKFEQTLATEIKINKKTGAAWDVTSAFNIPDLTSVGYSGLHITLTYDAYRLSVGSDGIKGQIIRNGTVIGDLSRDPGYHKSETISINIWRDFGNSFTVKLTVPKGGNVGDDYNVKNVKIIMEAY